MVRPGTAKGPVYPNRGSQCPDGSGRFKAAPGPDGNTAHRIPTGTVFNRHNRGGREWVWKGPADFAQHFGTPQGRNTNRRFRCDRRGCRHAPGHEVNTCLGGCDYCTTVLRKSPGVVPKIGLTFMVDTGSNECIKYCCPDIWRNYRGFPYRYDSAGCRALGVQQGTDYTATLKSHCKYVYTYAYEDHTSTFQCKASVSLQIMACPNYADFPSSD
uniref:Uncharacterized protein n=1 Tax=Plectus sambesii TaxID=2011161 RepID=A0A914X451_9BILA